jgi:hypothetical protein
MSCGREFRVKFLKRGMCKRCNAMDEDGFDLEFSDDIATEADKHDYRYNGDEIDDVEIDDFGLE